VSCFFLTHGVCCNFAFRKIIRMWNRNYWVVNPKIVCGFCWILPSPNIFANRRQAVVKDGGLDHPLIGFIMQWRQSWRCQAEDLLQQLMLPRYFVNAVDDSFLTLSCRLRIISHTQYKVPLLFLELPVLQYFRIFLSNKNSVSVFLSNLLETDRGIYN